MITERITPTTTRFTALFSLFSDSLLNISYSERHTNGTNYRLPRTNTTKCSEDFQSPSSTTGLFLYADNGNPDVGVFGMCSDYARYMTIISNTLLIDPPFSDLPPKFSSEVRVTD